LLGPSFLTSTSNRDYSHTIEILDIALGSIVKHGNLGRMK